MWFAEVSEEDWVRIAARMSGRRGYVCWGGRGGYVCQGGGGMAQSWPRPS